VSIKTREILEKHGIFLKKALGQNFLTADWVPEEIAEKSRIDKTCGVLEIGPGAGALTDVLCDYAAKVAAVELDERMLPILSEVLAGRENVKVIHGDALKVNLDAILDGELAGLTPVCCANLPYYITTPVLERLFELRRFERITVMVQKEVAERLAAKPGTSAYSSFTVYAQYFSEPEILFGVPAGCFFPRPKVDSAVIMFNMRSSPPDGVTDEALFFRVVRAAFGERRKTLVNGLCRIFGDKLSKTELTEIVTGCGFRADIRGERLGIGEFAALTQEIAKKL